jgi:hypothetical protein
VIRVSFQHWRYTFGDDMLSRYGSRYFSRREAGKAFAHDIHKRATREVDLSLDFAESQILCGNEAFPEVAVFDPIGDLEVWDEWRSGTRDFPYPGRYSRLGIKEQKKKSSSPASVGVLGEILAGFFAQAGVSPWVLVRGVWRWPDFIFAHPVDGAFNFVESKAFTSILTSGPDLASRVSRALLVEGALDASQELMSYPFGKVWLSLTKVRDIAPMFLDVTFLELAVSQSRQDNQPARTMPAAVANGLAERAVNQAVAKLGLQGAGEALRAEVLPALTPDRELQARAESEIEGLLREIRSEAVAENDREQLRQAIDHFVKRVGKKRGRVREREEPEGKRLEAAKRSAANSILSKLRDVGERGLFIADLSASQQEEVRKGWVSDWTKANRSWGHIEGADLWRCGGAVFCLRQGNPTGQDISKEALRGY